MELEGCEDAWAKLARARERLDGHRVRSRDGVTTAERRARMPGWYHAVDRHAFYDEARAAMKVAAGGCMSARARRRAERDALYAVLEGYGLVRRTRGGEAIPTVKPESIS